MKRILTSIFGILLLAAPAFALADGAIPIGPTPLQLLTAVAALEAQASALSSGQTLACAALFGAPSVAVNEPVALAWGSVGVATDASSSQSTWTQNGASTVSIQTPGAWTYSFTFYGAGGGSVTCTAKIVVTSAQ